MGAAKLELGTPYAQGAAGELVDGALICAVVDQAPAGACEADVVFAESEEGQLPTETKPNQAKGPLLAAAQL